MRINWIFSLVFIVLVSCKTNNPVSNESKASAEAYNGPKKYLALGDSYTIGESVDPNENFPMQIQRQLKEDGVELSETKIIAKTGWRTDNLLAAIDTTSLNPPYDLITLLIGVNNQYQGRNLDQLSKEYRELIDKAISLSRNGKDGLVLISIPDYSVSPFGKKKDPQKIRKEIETYNYMEEKIAEEYGLQFYNITPISREASSNETLLAEDGLHPSSIMYRRWLKVIYEPALKAIQ